MGFSLLEFSVYFVPISPDYCLCLFKFSAATWGASHVAQLVKNMPAMQETQGQSLGWEDPLENGMATHSSTLAWTIWWTEQRSLVGWSPWSRRVEHDWVTNTHTSTWVTLAVCVFLGIFPLHTGLSTLLVYSCSHYPLNNPFYFCKININVFPPVILIFFLIFLANLVKNLSIMIFSNNQLFLVLLTFSILIFSISCTATVIFMQKAG